MLITEQAIQTILGEAQTLLMHAAIQWPDTADTNLWQMAINYTPTSTITCHWHACPDEFPFRSTSFSLTFSRHAHLGYSLLCPQPQTPGWTEATQMEATIMLRSLHSFQSFPCILCPLVLNLNTGKISPQFHIVFNDWFTSVLSTGADV